MITSRVLLRKDRANKAGHCPLYIRITKSRKSAYITTGLKLTPDQWDHNRQRIKRNHPNQIQANALIKSILSDIEEKALIYVKNKVAFNVDMVKNAVLEGDTNVDVILFASKWINDRYERKEIEIGTLKRYEAIIEKVKEFAKDSLTLEEFNREFILDFESFLQKVKGNERNTIAANLSFLRAVSNALIQKDLLKYDNSPFKKYKITKTETKRKYITVEEIELIENVELPNGSALERSRDIFLFCNQSGLRIGDALRLKFKNYTGSHINIRRQKGKDLVPLPLTQKAINLIDKYIDKIANAEDYIFQFLDLEKQQNDISALKDQKSATALINKNLGIISKKVGLTSKVSTHFARHSMATNALSRGLSMEQIQAMLGHKNIKTTQIYAKSHSAMLEDAFKQLESVS